ncbi:MAG TPA: DUF4168 domain-containing protein [Caulobacteraceae bacterium]|nr:DUF4168 domain-containing protein [Caulobacteraceae bacterium]
MRTMMTIPAAAACLLMAGAAFAQTPAQPPAPANTAASPAAPAAAAAPAAPAAPTANFTDEELKKFIPLATQVKTIMDQHQPAITAATDPTAKVKEQNAMSGELQVAVTDAGLTVQRYNEIAQAMRSDPSLVTRMQQLAAAAQPATTATP